MKVKSTYVTSNQRGAKSTNTDTFDIRGEIFHKRAKNNPLQAMVGKKIIESLDEEEEFVEIINITTPDYSR